MINENALPTVAFSSADEFEKWLSGNHASSKGIWLKFAKKSSGIASITPAEALECALCYGWIDGQRDKFDNQYYVNKYTPRTKRSIWSKRNTEIAEKLIKSGKMRPAGLQAIKAAKTDGRWQKAYDSPANMEVPKDFLSELAKNKQAEDFYDSLNKANRYAIAWRLATAKKPETRAARMEKILAMMANGQRFH